MEDLIDTPALAQRLGIDESTANKWRLTGEGPPFVKLGRSVRYRLCDVSAWVASRVVRSTSEADALPSKAVAQ
jgi:predicted DNA-binding transcriptional regulator AlpA